MLLGQAEKAVSQGLSRLGTELGHAGGRLEWKEVTWADRKQGLSIRALGGAKANPGQGSWLPVMPGVGFGSSQAFGRS